MEQKQTISSQANIKTQPAVKPTITNTAPKVNPADQITAIKPVMKPVTTKPVLRPLTEPTISGEKGKTMSKPGLFIGLALIVILLGIGSGYGLTIFSSGTIGPNGLKNEPGLKREVASNEIKAGTKVGIADERTFKDTAEGRLEKGGVDGEGSHKLIRPGGDSQTIYMTSSVIDLDQFVGRKVKIWGETFSAQKAGWLMDVGKLEVLK